MERNKSVRALARELILLHRLLHSVRHGLQGSLSRMQELLEALVARLRLRQRLHQFLLDLLELRWILKYGGSQLSQQSAVLPSLRPLSEDDLVSIGGLRLSGGIDD